MPYLDTAQSWLTQSTLLLQARPTTTRITTKYTIRKPSSATKPSQTSPSTPRPDPPRAHLTLKTYCPTSGTTLKYRTTKAAEVSRLIQILGRLARPMAGLSVLPLDLDTPLPETIVDMSAVETPAVAAGGAAGAGGKKKKGKGGKK